MLKSDQKANWSYKQISEVYDVSDVIIAKVRKDFVEQGLERALERKKPNRTCEHIVRSKAPEGRVRWTLRLLQSEMIKRNYADEISHKTICSALKEMHYIPPKTAAAFMCQMEDVLDVYKHPYDPKRPLICMDEMPKQLLAEKYEPLPIKPEQTAKQDYGYERHSTANLFMLFEPLAGKRYVQPTSHRKIVDWAHLMKMVSDELYPDAEVVVVVIDNLNSRHIEC